MVVYSASSYDDPLKKLILKKHYGDAHASYQLGQIITSTLDLDFLKPDIIIPVPLHWTRYAQRGFNQAEIIAKVVGKKINKPVYNLFKRSRKTQLQAELTLAQRIENIAHAFAIKSRYHECVKELLAGKTILLVDDLYTTGATIKSMARELLPFKPAKIMVLVACRVL